MAHRFFHQHRGRPSLFPKKWKEMYSIENYPLLFHSPGHQGAPGGEAGCLGETRWSRETYTSECPLSVCEQASLITGIPRALLCSEANVQ